MIFREYEWDDINIEHINRHGVVSAEVEEVCHNEPLIMRTKEARYMVYGQTDAGRYLFIAVQIKEGSLIRVITARDMTKSERKLYHGRRG